VACTAIVGFTVYAATEDLALSLLLSVVLGLSALAASLLLLLNLRAGYLVGATSALGLAAFESIDIAAIGFRWVHVFYLTLGALVLLTCIGAETLAAKGHWRLTQRRSSQHMGGNAS
jgi:hypothetical protein